MFFEWSRYDVVIIQDIWASSPAAPQSRETLELAGYFFAIQDYYERGNFSTRKVIVTTDPIYASWRIIGQAKNSSDTKDCLRADLDPKLGLDFECPLDPGFMEELRRILRSDPGYGTSSMATPGRSRDAKWGQPVMRLMADALQRNLEQTAFIVMADDELKDLSRTYEAMTARRPGWDPQGPSEPNRKVYVAVSGEHDDRKPEDFQEFQDLVAGCERICQRLLASGKDRYPILVTDILFGRLGAAWDKTGIDLIAAIHERFGSSIGIIAYSGFSSPFVVTSAYERGADYVVHKIGLERSAAHQPIVTDGTQRLLLTASFICFQKQLLREKRDLCNPRAWRRVKKGSTLRERARAEISDLKRVLPCHSASPHIREEWLDTLYLLEAACIYEPESIQFRQAWQEIGERYDTR